MEVQTQTGRWQACAQKGRTSNRVQAIKMTRGNNKKHVLSVQLVCTIVIMLFHINVSAASKDVMSERTYKKLSRIHELVGKQQYDEALRKLDVLLPRVKSNLYETALVNQTYAYIYASRENYRKAISYYKKCLANESLNKQLDTNIRFSLGQIYILMGEYRKGIQTLQPIIESANKITPRVNILLATAYVELNDYSKAISLLETAIAQVPQPRESWLKLLLFCYYESGLFQKAAVLLNQLIIRFPDREAYWKQLSSVYYKINKPGRALAILELAYKRGLIDQSAEHSQLVNLYLLNKLPDKAAQVLMDGLNNGIIKNSEANWVRLADIWILAKENTRAIQAYKNAYALSRKIDTALKYAQALVNLQKWDDVLDLTGDVKADADKNKMANIYMYQGIAYFESGRHDKSLNAFNRVAKATDQYKNAQHWRSHVESFMTDL